MSFITAAIYRLSDGEIGPRYSGPADQLDNQCGEGEEFYLNCPLEATHIRNGQPVTIERVPTQDETRQQLTNAVQAHLDRTAKQRNYDNIFTACTYATSTVDKFRAEGQACVAWRDAVWSQCYEALDAVLAGTRPIPTADELIAELPPMLWP